MKVRRACDASAIRVVERTSVTSIHLHMRTGLCEDQRRLRHGQFEAIAEHDDNIRFRRSNASAKPRSARAPSTGEAGRRVACELRIDFGIDREARTSSSPPYRCERFAGASRSRPPAR